jgi:hypothetical protein
MLLVSTVGLTAQAQGQVWLALGASAYRWARTRQSRRCHTQRRIGIVDELAKLLSEKTGLSEEMAKIAVEAGVGNLEDNLPAPIASQVGSVLSRIGAKTDLGDLAQGLGSMLGKK